MRTIVQGSPYPGDHIDMPVPFRNYIGEVPLRECGYIDGCKDDSFEFAIRIDWHPDV